ncbi:MAG TPA: malto-oligosyltrehalose synthase [Puia sp.]|nr:malto-oligosyltrehalose synthase [Puia sp.]
MTSTYRIQLHKDFNFKKLKGVLEYLHELGISTLYASPITRAIKGSQHGYDVTDPGVVSPEIGSEQEMEEVSHLLKKYEMTWVQDIVPNHMAFEPANPWIRDVLEKGQDSGYYSFFDIEPDPVALLGNKLMLPFLGNTLTECIQQKEIKLDFTGGRFIIRYYQQEYPISALSEEWIRSIRPDSPAEQVVAFFLERPSLLKELLDQQHYVLTHSSLAFSCINYRRFFTINSLICLRMEDEKVFETYHRQIHCWFKKGLIQGLRLDHIDGLAAPRQYVQWLRHSFGEDCYMVAEKILAPEEPLPPDWRLQGTTGYEFLGMTGQLFTDAEGFHQLKNFYREKIVPGMPDYKDLVFEKKYHYLLTYMGGELDNLTHRAAPPEADRARFRNALAIFMSSFPVYRLYPEPGSLSPLSDVSGPLAAVPEEDRVLLQRALDDPAFLSRVMQFTGPLAAKGVEDTVFYVYNPLIARNEVGDSPFVDGLTPAEFHQKMILRQQTTPMSLNAGTTHDTKRGEDSRIRLCWLSAIPDEWIAAVTRWREMNKRIAPLPNDEYFIYQSLIGGFPPDMVLTGQFRQRFHDMLTKALREAKTSTNWDSPDEAYEKKCHDFVDALLKTESPFMEDFFPFVFQCIKQGARYSLSQLLLRLTAPGIPDIYQGAECRDLSFVDPDNRRPVDYALRIQLLQQIKQAEKQGYPAVLELVSEQGRRGAGKLYTIYKTLAYRNAYPAVFTEGEYIPIAIPGAHLAYIRRKDRYWVLIVIPLIRIIDEPVHLSVALPAGAPTRWTNIFSGDVFHSSGHALGLGGLLDKFPVAMLTAGTAEGKEELSL